MKTEELTELFESKLIKLKGAYMFDKPFFAPRVNASPTWAARAIKIEGNKVLFGHLVWDFSNVRANTRAEHFPWKDENRISFETMAEYKLDDDKNLGDLLHRLGLKILVPRRQL